MYVSGLPTLPPGLFLRPRLARWPLAGLDGNGGLYAYARDALHAGLGAIGLAPGDAALVPAYICASAVIPFVLRNIKILYYGLTPDLRPVPEDVRKGLSSARALYLIHYFGVAEPQPDLVGEARHSGLKIIRDMAHCLRGNPAQAVPDGDMRIWSLRKAYPVPDGGVLELPGGAEQRAASGAPGAMRYGMVGKLMLKNLALRAGWRLTRREPAAPGPRGDMEGSEWALSGRSISPVTLYLLRRCDPRTILEARRARFEAFAARLGSRNRGAAPLFTRLSEGVCPYAYPMLVERRDGLLHHFLRAGIRPEATFRQAPYRPPGAEEVRPGVLAEAAALADRMLSLPVIPELTAPAVDRIATIVEEWRE